MAEEDQYPELEPGIPVPEEPPVESRRVPSIVHASPFTIQPPQGVILESSRANQPYVPTDPTERMWAAMEREFGGLPLAQAQKAVETALKFQGMRTYQQELAKGTPAAEALAKAGPMLFGTSGMRGMGMTTPAQQAAQALREREFAFKQQQAAKPRIVHVGNRAYRENAAGQFEPVTPEPPPTHQARITLKEDEFGPAISGYASDKEIAERLARMKARDDAAAAESASAAASPGVLGRVKQALGFGATTVVPPAPAMLTPQSPIRLGPGITMGGIQPPAAAAPMAPATTTTATAPKFREGQLIRNKRTGKLYKIVNGVPVEQ